MNHSSVPVVESQEAAVAPETTAAAVPKSVDRPALAKPQINVIFGTILLGVLLSALDQTIVSTALPTIVGDLGGAGHMSWVVTSYLLAETISTVLAGKFGDLFGRKRIFQASVLIFIVGSFCCGLANDMTVLIVMRAVQGIGAGGISITATALIAELIPLRERGKYQGALGAMFGVTTAVGPLLGGLFTDHLSWRWAFYVNVPIAIVVIVLASTTIPGIGAGRNPKIDYLGVLFVALGASGLTLVAAWGGSQYPWGSTTILGLIAGSVAALVAFVLVECRAEEPILPMRLFGSRVFSIASVLSFIVGFTMLGSMSFMPSYLQYVGGASATSSGVRMMPMVLGLFLMAMTAGRTVSRTGQYKAFPISGAAVTAVGLFLLSRMGENTSVWSQCLAMFVVGAGIGLGMQVLTLIVQNTCDYRDLGTSTSGVTFFRALGGSFGASIMGTIYATRIGDLLPAAIARAGVSAGAVSSPEGVHALSASAKAPIVAAYAEAFQTMFLYVVPVAVFGLLIALALPQVRMRDIAQQAAGGAGEGFAVPETSDADTQLETLVGRVMARNRNAGAVVLARSGLTIDLSTAWGLRSIHLRARLLGRPTTKADVENQLGVPHGVLTSFYADIVDQGLLRPEGDQLVLTAAGEAAVARMVDSWRDWIVEELHEWLPDQDEAQLREQILPAVGRVARRAMLEQQRESSQSQPV